MSPESASGQSETTVHHPVFARVYARLGAAMEKRGAAEHREELLAGLAGKVIEVGAGTGLNFRHYPSSATEVLAVEPEPRLRRIATEEAGRVRVPVRVVDGVADVLPAADAAFDAGVASLVLCSIPEPAAALAEMHRVIRPRGELRFYEHVRANSSGFARFQRAVDLVWPLLGGGCHTSRDTLGAIERAGFVVTKQRRFQFAPCLFTRPVAPHVIGLAQRS
jgi:ubiquinone/menaquinone biosynthesis C-methylase UbiE